jgi:hypothetical protein
MCAYVGWQRYSTEPAAHMPESHRRYAVWTPSRIVAPPMVVRNASMA